MTNGYNGKILRVNLTRNTTEIEQPNEIFFRRYFGGRALIAHYLLKELKPGIDPLGPENKLIFSSGVVTGTPVTGSGRNSIGAKSPLTGGYGDAEVGGYWGAEFKKAGWDTVIIEGKATSPVYLSINNDQVEIKDASSLWGKDTGEVIKAIQNKLGDKNVRVASIGIGGENLVRYACIIEGGNDAAGRCGLGAVMGSKKLKAIAVRGTGQVAVSDMDTLRAMTKKMSDKMPLGISEYGTAGSVELAASTGTMPFNNFRDGPASYYKDISGSVIKNSGLRVGMDGCWGCMIRCKTKVKIDEGKFIVDPYYGGPEYETIGCIGSCCGLSDIKAICKANELCNRHSIDTISCGVTISFAMECYENGLINKEDTGGLELRFGDAETVVKLVDMIGKREGFGDLLAEGSMRAAERIGKGAKKYAVNVKGLEVPAHEPRRKRGLAVGYAVSPTGADHEHNLHDSFTTTDSGIKDHKPFGIIEPVPLEDIGPRKVRLLLYTLNWKHMYNCMHMCMFVPWSPNDLVQITQAVTGWETSVLELAKLGERAINLTRVFNVREGFSVKEDILPDRFYSPQTSGPLSNTALDRKELENAVQIYYKMMGWDAEGVPSREKLEELDIGWACDCIEGC